MTKRRSISTKERARLFTLHGGNCHICGGKIQVGEAWEVEHCKPFELSYDDSDDNRKPAHVKCHKGKTAIDRVDIARAHRREQKHLGFKQKQPWNLKWKRKVSGEVILR